MSSVGANKLLLSIFGLLYLLVIGDCVSTYLCLTTVSDSYAAWESNPISAWIFQQLGLIPGLVAMLVVKGFGVLILNVMSKKNKSNYIVILVGMLGAVLITGYVNYNNWGVYYHLVN
jgi:hypothetical protein